MLTRINFLFSISILILLLFYFAGRFVFVVVISRIAPGLVPYFISAYVLAALMLMVLAVARVVIRLDAISAAARAQRLTLRAYTSQIFFCLAHLCVLFGMVALFASNHEGTTWWPWFAGPALYVGGIAFFVGDLRERALRSSFQI